MRDFQDRFNSPHDEEGTPERSEGGEVIQLKHLRDMTMGQCLTSPAALRGGRPLLVKGKLRLLQKLFPDEHYTPRADVAGTHQNQHYGSTSR
jgi:hypothetical protein